MTAIDRRHFLTRGALLAGGSVLSVPALQALSLRAAGAGGTGTNTSGGYGPLTAKTPAVVDTEFPGAAERQWLALPEGFDYAVFGVSGDEMTDGNVTPIAHDGMAAFEAPRNKVRLVRNHENRDPAGPPIGGPTNAYDMNGAGGTTTLELAFGKDGLPELEQHFVSLNGTIVNCAGGLTPAGSWISSEETKETRLGVKHGYNFEVPSSLDGIVEPVALTAMGRFSHEALCVDPATGIVYETEDDGDSGFYRFVPDTPGDFTAGRLQMLKISGRTNFDTKTGQTPGRPLPVEWVEIEDPDPAAGGKAVFDEGKSKGGAIFSRLEGCWFGNGAVYFNATNAGDAHEGQVWQYKPSGRSSGFLTLVYESPGIAELSFPDNITVTPRGGILLCEDTGADRANDPWSTDGNGGSVQYLKGLTASGRIFDFAANLLDDKEWAGACFSPDGRYLFVNGQGATRTPDNLTEPGNVGRTYAIWGPWESGSL